MASRKRLSVSEDINGQKWDRCLTDTVVKAGRYEYILSSIFIHIILASGLALGLVFSAILFKRKHIFSY
jgi:hypothetical protein